MLSAYKNTYARKVNQMLLLNPEGLILDCQSVIFDSAKGKVITSIHPFFETIVSLLSASDQDISFSCVNLEVENKAYILDIQLKTFKGKQPALLIIDDLTKQYNAYQPIAQRRNESKIKSELIGFKNELLLQKEAFKNQFIANFSHEIRMPINTISGLSILLENSNLSQPQRYNLDVIKNTNERLKHMINDILDISKIDTGYLPILEQRFDLLEELQTLADIYTKACDAKGLQLEYHIDESCPQFVEADKFRLAQISNNLIGNAIKFTNSGSISLSVKPIKQTTDSVRLEFTVKDTGIGIDKAKLDAIFTSFYQISNTQQNAGSGLGLAIVKRLVNALNGDMTVTSAVGKGSEFKVALDFKVPKDQSIAPKNLFSIPSKTKFTHRILAAETSRSAQSQLLEILEETGLYKVVMVDNGDAVVEELYKASFDLLLLNLRLPNMDGFDTTRFIRHSDFPAFQNTPIIGVSNFESEKEKAYCLDKGMNGYLSKPYQKVKVLKMIKSLTKKKRTK